MEERLVFDRSTPRKDSPMKTQALVKIVLIAATPCCAVAGDLTKNQRDSILKGMFQMCLASAPQDISQRFGPMGVKRFCSCYADEIANNLTKEQFNAMVVDPNTGRSKIPPNYATTVSKANHVCAKELISQ